jgi:hypothetical protein
MMLVIAILNSFSSVTHVWVPGAKATGPIFFSNLIFSAVRNFKFQYDPFRNLKDVSERSILK